MTFKAISALSTLCYYKWLSYNLTLKVNIFSLKKIISINEKNYKNISKCLQGKAYMLTLSALNHQKFTVTLQMHEIIQLFFFWEVLCLVKGICYMQLLFANAGVCMCMWHGNRGFTEV